MTGANGLLGQALVQCLSASPMYDVLATGNDTEPRFIHHSCGYTRMDVRDRAGMTTVFENFTPTVVINCAALTQVDRCETERSACWAVNATSVRNLAKECHGIGAHLIQVSTDFVFDGEDGPYDETHRPNPINFYGKAKLAGENAVREAGMGKWTVVRTNVVFGAGRHLPRNNFVSWVRQELSQGKPVHVFTDQLRTPTYAVDLALGIERLIHLRKRGVYNLSGKVLVSMFEFARSIAQVFCLDPGLVCATDSSTLVQVAPRPLVTGFNILKAETELGFRPRSIPTALSHMARSVPYELCLN